MNTWVDPADLVRLYGDCQHQRWEAVVQSMFMKARTALETKGRFAAGAVPDHIADSWHRCLQHGLDPTGEPLDADIGI